MHVELYCLYINRFLVSLFFTFGYSALSIFCLNENAKIPVQDACRAMIDKHPELTVGGAGRIISAAFGDAVTRKKPGPMKHKKRTYFYHGLHISKRQLQRVSPLNFSASRYCQIERCGTILKQI